MENYIKFLNSLMRNIDKYFEEQSPYIKCKRGCTKCCSNGDYPFSEIEIELLKIGFNNLNENTKIKIRENIENIIKLKTNCDNKDSFTYECPFLINEECSVYLYRGIICRTFGLIYIKQDSKQQIPFCAYEGLNYSDILDKEKGMLTIEKMQENGLTIEPKAYNIHYDFLTSDEFGKMFGFNFGKRAAMIDLLEENGFYKI